jgi:hypothetical protein
MVSSPIWLLFWYWGGDREAAEVALRMSDTPMAPDTLRPYPSHDLIHPTMSSLCYSFPPLFFHTTHLSFSILQAMHRGSSGERFDPGEAHRRRSSSVGGRMSPVLHAEDPLPPHPGSEPQGHRACRRLPPRGAHRRLGWSSPRPLLCAAPSSGYRGGVAPSPPRKHSRLRGVSSAPTSGLSPGGVTVERVELAAARGSPRLPRR